MGRKKDLRESTVMSVKNPSANRENAATSKKGKYRMCENGANHPSPSASSERLLETCLVPDFVESNGVEGIRLATLVNFALGASNDAFVEDDEEDACFLPLCL